MKILKRREPPLELLQLAAAIARLDFQHPRYKEIEQLHTRQQKGYDGEVSCDYFLQILPNDYEVICQLRLELNKHDFQIDTLIISRTALYICELKSYSTHVIIDHANDVLRCKGKDYTNPVSQVERQKLQLERFLQQFQLHVPIECCVVFSERTTNIEQLNGHASFVMRATQWPSYISRREEVAGRVRYNSTHVIDVLLKHHKEKWPTLTLESHDYYIGVRCAHCQSYQMHYTRERWQCLMCDEYDETAHLRALKEYALLIRPYITRAEAMKFLRLRSERTTTRLLQRHFQMKKHGRFTTYDLLSLFKS